MITRPRPRVASVEPLPAPVGGIDDTSSVASMDPIYALEMLNFYPGATELEVRGGYKEWATGLSSPAKTLMPFNGPASDKLFAATDDGVFDITSSGAVGAAVKVITEGRMNFTQFANVANQYLIAVNGVDPGFLYDGTSFVDFISDATPTNPGEIDGVDPDLWVNVHSYKRRLWFVEKDSMTAWYLPIDAVSGTASAFYLGGVFTKGGYLQNITTWTMDSGSGLDDLLIFQSSKGEIAVYTGTDPSNAATWFLQAVYFVGAPLGDRTNTDLNGDLALLTQYGVVAVSSVIGGIESMNAEQTMTKRIIKTLNTIMRQRSNAPNWEIINVPLYQSMFIIFPPSGLLPPVQYVMNTITGAWSSYDLPMLTSEIFGNDFYFSDNTSTVYVYGKVQTDGVNLAGAAGNDIESGFRQAYTDFGMPGVNKEFTLARALITSEAQTPGYTVTVVTDFQPFSIIDAPSPPASSGGQVGVWDESLWDDAVWSAGPFTVFEWVGVQGIGFYSSFVLRMKTDGRTTFSSSLWAFKPGGAI